MEKIIPDAVLSDPRSLSEKYRDHTHEELYGGLPAVWTDKPRSLWSIPSQRNQSTSLSCVKQSSATAIEKFLKQVVSAGTYELRADKTQGGMYLQNCGDLDYSIGTILESVTQSQYMDEQQMNSIVLPSTLNIKITGYRIISNPVDIELIAQAIQAYGNCILIFHSNIDEWLETPIYLGSTTNFGHAICAVDFTVINGIKTIVCMDSAAQWSSPTGVRLITEDFLGKRCVGAMYYTGVKIDPIQASTDLFLLDMVYGQTSPEIKRLQKFLKSLGYFNIDPTGYYGDITRNAVYHFQLDKVKLSWYERNWLKGSRCGPATRAVLNSLIK